MFGWMIGCAVDERAFPSASSETGTGGTTANSSENSLEPGATSPEQPLDEAANVAQSGMVSASPADLDLGAHPIGEPTPSVEWTLTNGGPNALTGLELVGDALSRFQISNRCGEELAAGQSCVVSLAYIPSAPEDEAAGLTLRWLGGQVRLIVRARGLPWVNLEVQGAGRVTSTPPGIDCPGSCRAPFDRDLEIVLRASPSPGARVASWAGSGCEGPVGTCTLPPLVVEPIPQRDVRVSFFEPVNNLVFVASETFTPTLGGTAPYDAACNRLATAAGLDNASGNGYIAAISDANSFFWQRLAPGVRGWQRMDGLAFADTVSDLIDGGIVFHPVAFEETGRRVAADLARSSLSGLTFDGSLGQHCSNWTSLDGDLQAGSPADQGPGGILGSWELATLACDAPYDWTITCLGNTSTAPLQRQISAGRRIWVTNTRIEIGSMTPDEACQAQRPSGVSTASALIAYTHRAASAVLDPEANYVRPDGTLVASGELLVDALRHEPTRFLNTGLWQTADGTYLLEGDQSVHAWAGALDLATRGTPGTTCNDWTTTEGEALWGRIPYASDGLWSWAGPDSCVTSNFFYCVER